MRCRWRDTINFTNLSSVSHYGHKSDWKTIEGIALGTTIDGLEKLNEDSSKSLFSTVPLQISSDADSAKTANLAVGVIELWDMQIP
ncbi:hypothetical protein SanaruYs_27730 [Chryseotalea sanaruensis]|uniref:Uncharacterized protein n=1 Tax=Chryseotalea sanaruensis TaxID=2482724 RepID=A0A401UCB6_9BACT|nr:hypothetical protein [Chryseotalea sanaruensis]GCC52536.1 hypothetical protein SanaruYs_27730 [Chryseotalea sanaruensis]